jgi:hypothetical protein
MKPFEIVPRRRKGKRGRMMERLIQLRYILNTYVNITMFPSVQLLYANKIINKNLKH